ncbi:MAG: patatin-like phospholipase family protein [Bacteroidia bacterium]
MPLLSSLKYFFPIKLLIVHLKYNLVLVTFWVVLFGFILKWWGNNFGVPLLFLDPEYLGKVDFFSYLVLGACCGAFIMAFQIASYIVNSHRFPFLASVSRPFVKYTVNNFIIPVTFISVYLISAFGFQVHFETSTKTDILFNISGFVLGALFFYVLSLTYFFTVSKDIFKLFGIDILKKTDTKKSRRVQLKGNVWKRVSQREKLDHVEHIETYISGVRIIRARDTAHYDHEIVKSVFRQNHKVAAIFELGVVIVMILLGLFRDIPFFMIPAAGSIFLSMTMLLMVASAFHTWLKSWSLPLFIVLALGLNYISGYEFFGKRNRAYGLDYSKSAAVIPDSMLYDRQKSIQKNKDTKSGIQSLESWKKKAQRGSGNKPTIIFLNVSGGGLKSALWTVHALQEADKACGGSLFKNTKLITGSSGGMIGASYFRELYLRSLSDSSIDIYNKDYCDKIAMDLLNPVGFALAVSDVFFRFQQVSIAGKRYTRDRAYEFEKTLHSNTDEVMNKALISYADSEFQSDIPTMVFSPTVINDGRRLLISAQPISYLALTPSKTGSILRSLPEDIEFSRFFKDQGADSLRFSTAIRMSATFPYILPSVSLPSEPILEVMDAGFRDNYGIKTSMRYLFHFRKWISENTNGVIFLQIRENHKAYDLKTPNKNSIFELISSPLGNVYENMFRIQDYQHDELIMYSDAWFDGKVEYIELDLNPPSHPSDQIISMNFHLTSLEKSKVLMSINAPENKAAINKIKTILKGK